MTTEDQFLESICDCPACQAPSANASVAFDPDNMDEASLFLNFPLDDLRQTVNLNGERRVVVQFDFGDGALEFLEAMVVDAANFVREGVRTRQSPAN